MTADFFTGGGSMGALMRGLDASCSPLGPPAQWPPPLRTAARLLLTSGHPMCLWWGPAALALYNDAYLESLGADRHPGALGRPAREAWGRDWDRVRAPVERVTGGGGPVWEPEWRVDLPSGSPPGEAYWACSYSPIDDPGAPLGIGGVLAVCAPTALHGAATQHQLDVERERLDLALAAGGMGAYEFNLDAQVLWWSPQMYALFGVDPERFVPTAESVSALIHPDDRDRFTQARLHALAQHRPFSHEFRVGRGDGTIAWIGHRGQADYDAAGRPVRSFGVAMDITERKHVEELLREADRKKDHFIAILAHELRNPLAPIRNAIAILRRSAPAADTAEWCHDVIERQVAQMARLLDDLLDVSRISRGQLRLRPEPLVLATAIERAVELAQPLIDAAGHAFGARLPSEPLPVQGDLTRLAQVFSNLLINAAKFTPHGGRIALDAERQGDVAVVRVSDNGIGIAAQDMAQIFQIFGQVASAQARSQGGQGIGLALAKGLVEMHGGTIAARSGGLGLGCTFEVRLPLSPSGAVPEPAPPATPAARTTDAGPPCRILIADDLHDGSDSLAVLLRAMGHAVEVAYDGDEALRRAEATHPDAVLLDLGMPKLDGLGVCRRIRATAWGAGVLLIAQSGWGQAQDRQRSREAGFDHHLTKPVAPSVLVALVAAARRVT